jgi:hypothetical protein
MRGKPKSGLLYGPANAPLRRRAPDHQPLEERRQGCTIFRRKSDQKIDRQDGPAVILDKDGQWKIGEAIIFGPAEIYYKQGIVDGSPAVIIAEGGRLQEANYTTYDGPVEIHYKQGKRDNDSEPALVAKDYQAYYKEGKMHRLDGPAVVGPNGSAWMTEGQLHREDGPALISSSGEERYYIDGHPHREDGPALVDSKGGEGWWWKGQPYPNKAEYMRAKALDSADA